MLIVFLCRLVSEAHSSESFDGYTFYFGDLHAHTGISPDGGSSDQGNPCDAPDVCGSLADVFLAARDTYHLDFVAFTEHSAPATDEELYNAFLLRIRDEEVDYSPLVVIPAAERVLRWLDGEAFIGHVGHKTRLLLEDDVAFDALDFEDFRNGTKTFTTCGDVWLPPQTMSNDFGPTLEFAHHPAAGNIMTTDWECHDQTYQPVVEVYSGWGNSLDPQSDYDPLQFPVEGTFVHDALEAYDRRVGFVSGTDIHDTRPGAVCAVDSSDVGTHIYGGGLTMIVLPEDGPFARSTIYGELVARRSLVTTGPRMPVSVQWITSDGVTHAIGEELVVHDTSAESTILSVKVPSSWEAYVDDVRAVGHEPTDFARTEVADGEWIVEIPNDQLPKWLYVEVAIDGALYYDSIGVGPCVDEPTDDDGDGIDDPLDDREFVWSSPVWFDPGTDLDADTHLYGDTDCNDFDAEIRPDAMEIWYDGIDQNCDERDDFDQDWDGYTDDVDCDDTNASVYPGADEVWHDGIDQDCDGHDLDQDGDGYLYAVDDCNDFDPAVNPAATEVCGPDDVDDDCDASIDDADSDTVPYNWYVDNDHDTYGQNGAVPVVTCEIIAGSVTRSGDCNDTRPRIHPGARDIPGDGRDEDCDGIR